MTTPDIQNQIGNSTTASSPFVTAGDVIYFRGTDNKLCRVNSDGSGQAQIGKYTTKSTPFVTPDGWVWFQGTDNHLNKVFNDGSQFSRPEDNDTLSPPTVVGDMVYWQGPKNELFKMNTGGYGNTQIGKNTTKSTPFVTPDGWVWFQGTDNHLNKVFNDGSQLSRPGANDTNSTPVVGRVEISAGTVGEWIYFQSVGNALTRLFQPVDPIATGTMLPKYYVLTLVYAPPGANGGKSGCLVDYSSGSSTGTTTTTSSSFKAGNSLSASAGVKVPGAGSASVNAQFTSSTTTTDQTSENITKSQTYDIKVPGPGKDGINHDNDMFVLMLNPLVAAAVYPGNNILWTMGINESTPFKSTMNIQWVYVAWLKNPSTMETGVKAQLDAAGLTATDYAQILSLDPFADGASSIDPNRFYVLPESFPYEEPATSADQVPTSTQAFSNANMSSTGVTVQEQYGVSVSVSEGIDIGVFSATLKDTESLQWTNKNSLSTSTTVSQSAAVTVGGPAFGYTGPTDVLVYWDSIYNSFMFAFPSEPPVASGTLLDSAGKPVALKAVTLTVGGHTFKTSTSAQGRYRFYGAPSGSGSLAVDGQNFAVPVGPGAAPPTLRLK
jgi:Domain of unknown function (DUF5050)